MIYLKLRIAAGCEAECTSRCLKQYAITVNGSSIMPPKLVLIPYELLKQVLFHHMISPEVDQKIESLS